MVLWLNNGSLVVHLVLINCIIRVRALEEPSGGSRTGTVSGSLIVVGYKRRKNEMFDDEFYLYLWPKGFDPSHVTALTRVMSFEEVLALLREKPPKYGKGELFFAYFPKIV